MNSRLVQDIGEKGLLQKIRSFCDSKLIGDDGAVIDISPHHQLIVTADVLVDRVHFSDRTTSAFDVGWRAASANLSDLAAMGANPLGITVSLSLPGTTPVAWVEQMYQGLNSCLRKFATSIVGGDITRSSIITVAISAFGEVLPHQTITRFSAQPGDAILVTGYHGLSRAGLEILLEPKLAETLTFQEKAFLIEAHQRPRPRLDVIKKLREIAPDALVTGMDSSDGLGDAIAQICHCSGVGAIISGQSISRCSILDKLSVKGDVNKWILNGGEDFELILCMNPQLAQKLLSYLENGAAIIGHIQKESNIEIVSFGENTSSNFAEFTEQFQHFKKS